MSDRVRTDFETLGMQLSDLVPIHPRHTSSQVFVPGHDTFSTHGANSYKKSCGDAVFREDRSSMLIVVQVAIVKCYDNCSGRPDSSALNKVEKRTQRNWPVMLPQVADHGSKSLFADCYPVLWYIVGDAVEEEYRCRQGPPRGPYFVAQPLNS